MGILVKKELWTFGDNRIAVRFEYEWQDDTGHWYRSHGSEMVWEFNADGLMVRRYASIDDTRIRTHERRLFSPERPPATAEVLR